MLRNDECSQTSFLSLSLPLSPYLYRVYLVTPTYLIHSNTHTRTHALTLSNSSPCSLHFPFLPNSQQLSLTSHDLVDPVTGLCIHTVALSSRRGYRDSFIQLQVATVRHSSSISAVSLSIYTPLDHSLTPSFFSCYSLTPLCSSTSRPIYFHRLPFLLSS